MSRLAKPKKTKTMRWGHDQETRRSSGRKDVRLTGGAAAAYEIGSPPRHGESGSGEDDAGASRSRDWESRFGSGGFNGLSSKRLIVFQRVASWANRRQARRRPAAKATRGGR